MKVKSLLFSVFLTTVASAQSYSLVEDQSNLRVETPSLAERKTAKLRLENGLEVYLISDPGTHESGAALAVDVGTWDDPIDRPGMAHFVEHLLFLGNEKYPNESEYQRYLDECGGNQNAFTANDRTVYIFSVDNPGFEGALDRFAHFFISPLFNPSGVERESEAVDQEFCKNVSLDYWRASYVKKELSNSDHPYHRFCIGNRQTLGDISQDELKSWYNDHYSANIMHLAVYSNLPMDELQEKAAALFSKISNKNQRPAYFDGPLFSTQTMGKIVAITPLKDVQKLELTWEMPPAFGSDQENHADRIASYIIGHEGANSLLAQLKKEQLAESLACGREMGGRDQHFFTLSIDLTKQGLEEYERVIERCFEALASWQKGAIPKYIFDEIQRKSTLEYTFQQRKEVFSLVTEIAASMPDEPLETFPQKNLLPTRYDEGKLSQFLQLLTPKNCRFTLIANPQLCGVKCGNKEQWIGANYGLLPIASEKVEFWSSLSPHAEITLPAPNRFLPESLSLLNATDKKDESPRPILENRSGKVFHCSDTQFFVPEIAWNFTFKTPEIKDENHKSLVLADLYCHAMNEKLNGYSYEAMLGGLEYELDTTHNGIKLAIKGYSEKAPELLTTLVSEFNNIQPAREEFQLYQATLQREYTNRAKANLVAQGLDKLWSLLYKEYTPLAEKAQLVSSISYEDFLLFSSQIWKISYIEGTFYGNLTEKQAIQVFGEVQKTFDHSLPYPQPLHPKVMMASFAKNKDPAYLTQKSELPGNAIILALDCGDFSFKKQAALQILTKGLEEPFFSELRTRQQTGYLVANLAKELERHLYSFFVVQSSSHDNRDLLARFELFLESSLQNLSSELITEERFDSIRTALIHSLENPAENLPKKGQLYHTLAFEYDGDFEWLETRIAGLKELKYDEFRTLAEEFLSRENKQRLAVCINGTFPKQERFRYRHLTSGEKLRRELRFSPRIG